MAWRFMTTWLIVAVAGAPAAAQQSDPIAAARFSITIDGHEVASFSELASLDLTADPPTIVLRRGQSASAEMWSWHEATRQTGGRAGRKNAVLVAYDRAGKPVARYHLTDAWPSKIQIGRGVRSDAKRAETVMLVCRRVQRAAP